MTGELVDVIDEHDRVIGTVSRAEMRSRNLRHRAVGVAILGTDGRLLIHRRSTWKDVWPGWWDIAVGGVVAAGETYDAAARRELAEEVGLTAGDGELTPLGTGSYDDDQVRLICHGYLLVHDGPFSFDDGEVTETRWVTAAQLAGMRAEHPFLPDSVALLLPLLQLS